LKTRLLLKKQVLLGLGMWACTLRVGPRFGVCEMRNKGVKRNAEVTKGVTKLVKE